MLKYQNLTIVGTNHVSKDSITEIQDVMKQGFSAVAIELDKKRLYALLHPSSDNGRFNLSMIFKVGFKGFLFAILGRMVQKNIGKKMNVEPGSDMLEAYMQAKKAECKIFLVDQEIDIVLKRISKEITFKEKMRFFKDLFYSFLFPKKYAKKYNLENFNFGKVPDSVVIEELLKVMKNDYPSVHKILVEDRNKLMAKRIYRLMNTQFSVLAVVGAGHEQEIINILKELFSKNTDVLFIE